MNTLCFDAQVAVAVLNNGRRPEIPAWCPPYFASLLQVSHDHIVQELLRLLYVALVHADQSYSNDSSLKCPDTNAPFELNNGKKVVQRPLIRRLLNESCRCYHHLLAIAFSFPHGVFISGFCRCLPLLVQNCCSPRLTLFNAKMPP